MDASPVMGISAVAYNFTTIQTPLRTSSPPKIEQPEPIERVGTPKEDVLLRSAILNQTSKTESKETIITKPSLPSDEWMGTQLDLIFSFTKQGGWKLLDKKILELVKLNLETWGVPERLSDLVNAKDAEGKTPLIYAIDRHSTGHIAVLRKYGAEVTPEILSCRCVQTLNYIRDALTK
jgi:hypothetical protein